VKAQVLMILAASAAFGSPPSQGQIDTLNASAAALRDLGAGAGALAAHRAGLRDPGQREVAGEVRLLAEGARQVLFALEKLLVLEREDRNPDQMRWIPSARRVMVADLLDYCRRGRASAQACLDRAGDDHLRALVQGTVLALGRLEAALRDDRRAWDGRGPAARTPPD